MLLLLFFFVRGLNTFRLITVWLLNYLFQLQHCFCTNTAFEIKIKVTNKLRFNTFTANSYLCYQH